METSIEERLSAIEKALGIGDGVEAKSSDLDIYSVRKCLEKKGFSTVMKVPIEKLKHLKKFTEEPSSRPLSEKLTTIECCEELIRQRARLLQEFEEKFKTVTNCEHLSGVPEHEKVLDQIEKEIEDTFQVWKLHTSEFEEFKDGYARMISVLQRKLKDLEEKVAIAERRKAAKAQQEEQ